MVDFVELYSRLYAWGVVLNTSEFPTPIVTDSRLNCMRWCVNNSNCSSYYFNKPDRACYLHNRWVNGLVTADPPTDTNYFVMYTRNCWYTGYEYLRSADMCIRIQASVKNNWSNAEDDCQLEEASLAQIDSQEKMSSVMSLLKSDFPGIIYFWIDGNDMDVEGSWKWKDGSDIIDYYWASPEPNNSGDCLAIGVWGDWDGWDDYTCTETELYICERK